MPSLRPVTVNVTADDIRLGTPGHGALCPVGRAFGPILKPIRSRWVTYTALAIGGETGNGPYPFPYAVTLFLFALDNHAPVYPISFEMDLPREVLR